MPRGKKASTNNITSAPRNLKYTVLYVGAAAIGTGVAYVIYNMKNIMLNFKIGKEAYEFYQIHKSMKEGVYNITSEAFKAGKSSVPQDQISAMRDQGIAETIKQAKKEGSDSVAGKIDHIKTEAAYARLKEVRESARNSVPQEEIKKAREQGIQEALAQAKIDGVNSVANQIPGTKRQAAEESLRSAEREAKENVPQEQIEAAKKKGTQEAIQQATDAGWKSAESMLPQAIKEAREKRIEEESRKAYDAVSQSEVLKQVFLDAAQKAALEKFKSHVKDLQTQLDSLGIDLNANHDQISKHISCEAMDSQDNLYPICKALSGGDPIQVDEL